LIEKDSSFESDIPVPIELRVSKSLYHHDDLLTTVSQINLLKGDKIVYFVYLSGERLYSEADKTLYVYSISDHTSPIATYQLGSQCRSGIITDNYLYLGGEDELHIFEATSSLTQPLIPCKSIKTKGYVFKILRVCNELILGE
jgi:hypothetical protein